MSARRRAGGWLFACLLLFGCIPKRVPGKLEGPVTVTPDAEFRRHPPAVEHAAFPLGAPVQRNELENGLVVLTVERPDLPLATLLYVNRVAYDEQTRASHGLARLVVDALATASLDASGHAVRGPELDGQMLAYQASPTGALLGLTATTERTGAALDLLAATVRRPAFDAASLDESKRYLQALATRQAAPEELRRATLGALYGIEHPLTWPALGEPLTLARFSQRDVRHYYARRFGPKHSAVIAVGGIETQSVVASARAAFADWNAPEALAEVAPPPAPKLAPSARGPIVGREWIAAVALVMIGLPCVGFGDPDELGFELISRILTGGLGSRSAATLRHAAGATYAVRSSCIQRKNAGEFLLTFDVEPSRFGDSLTRVLAEFKRLATQPVAQAELEAAKRSFLVGVSAQQATNDGLAQALASLYATGQPDDYYTSLESRVRAITPEQIQRTAERHFRRERLRVAVFGDLASLRQQPTELGPIRQD